MNQETPDRPVYEIVFGLLIPDIVRAMGFELPEDMQGKGFKLLPYALMTPGDMKESIDDGILAAFDFPYHPPIEEDERIYALNMHVAGKGCDEIVLQYAFLIEPHARQIYLDYKHFAKPLMPDFEEGDTEEDNNV
jgi:hypothetical protein